jgi:hypothetical protein
MYRVRTTRAVRPLLQGAAAALALTAAGIAQAGAAEAGTVHSVVTAPSPSNGAPIDGGGSWIVNKPSGYYLGRELPGGRFDNEANSGGWHYGRAVTGINMCGWAMPHSVGARLGTVADSCSAAVRGTLSHRRNVGRDFNAPAHRATDGSPVPANTGCTLYLNYFHGTGFAGGANGGHWANPAGAPGSSVRYRFTTLDGRAVVVRDTTLGWGFLPIGCVQRPATRYNDND